MSSESSTEDVNALTARLSDKKVSTETFRRTYIMSIWDEEGDQEKLFCIILLGLFPISRLYSTRKSVNYSAAMKAAREDSALVWQLV